jgi:hypothetical protein
MNTPAHDAEEVVRRVQLGEGSRVTLPVPAEVRAALYVDTGDDRLDKSAEAGALAPSLRVYEVDD